jgi:uncharacterized membrane protein YgcG
MTGPFRPRDLDGADESLSVVEQAQALGVARELEAAALAVDIRPSPGFSDRVMSAVAAEPLPRPVTAFGRAARQGRARAAVAALADTWRVAWSGGPLAARAQALAMVVVLIVATASVSGVAIAGVAGMLGRSTVTLPSPPAMPSTVAPPSEEASPSPTPSPEPSATPEPTETSEPTATPKRTTPRPAIQPTQTPEGGDNHGGGDGSGSGGSDGGGESEDVSTPGPTGGGD